MNTTDTYNMTLFGEKNTAASQGGRGELWYWRVGLVGIGGAVIECVGIICNIIAIIVLANFRSSSSAPFLLICLSVFDSIYLLTMLLLENISFMEVGEVIRGGYREFMIPVYAVLYPTPFLMQTCIIYLVVVITIERFAVVAWPFVAHRLCSIRSARIAVLAIILFGVVYHIPTYKAYTLRTEWDNVTQSWRRQLLANDFGQSRFYTKVYIQWINIFVNFAIPFVLLAVFNYFMIMSLRKIRMNVTARRTFTMEERRLTVMVICMTSIFFVCELLAATSQIVLNGFSNYQEPTLALNRLSAIADISLMINSAINFIIYCVSGRKFRQTFVQLFCQHTRKPNQKQPFTVTAGSKKEYSKAGTSSYFTQPRKPKRSTTESSLSSISNGTRSSKCTSSDSIHKKLSVKNTEEE